MITRVTTTATSRVISHWADQVSGARDLGLTPETLLVNAQDYGIWYRALGSPRDVQSRFGGVTLHTSDRLQPGEARVLVDFTQRP